jgi:predicted TIM-barrel fold metal-dependent hydrolase
MVPELLSAELVSRPNGRLKHKMLFGSDFPLIAPDRWINDFNEAGFKSEVHDLISKQNAIRALTFGESA